jgi:hypothetical protein
LLRFSGVRIEVQKPSVDSPRTMRSRDGFPKGGFAEAERRSSPNPLGLHSIDAGLSYRKLYGGLSDTRTGRFTHRFYGSNETLVAVFLFFFDRLITSDFTKK